MFNKLVKYLKNDEYLISLSNSFIHVINYKSIMSLNNNRVELMLENKILIITGEDFIIEKMEKSEMRIKGKITNIEIK